MPPRMRGGKARRAARHSLDALPDDVLRHVLSFLPAQDAVRTCVLARRWRNLWKSVTRLRISYREKSVMEVREFVDHLLLLREFSPLDTCELELYNYEDEDIPRMTLWVRHLLMRNVRVLSLNFSDCCDSTPMFVMDNKLVLVSQHLKKLHLSDVKFSDSFLTFSSCPALEVLEFNYCEFVDCHRTTFSSCPALEVLEFNHCEFVDCHRISSESLKFLSFHGPCIFYQDFRPDIYCPNLISLWLEVSCCTTPLLERMPFLVEAVVELRNSAYGPFIDADSGGSHGDTRDCMVLQAVSEAQSLVLISYISAFVFRRDLKCCPTFSNLKTLLLNECWCMLGDFSSLTYILEHSPVLEKLTLQLFCTGPKSKVEMKGSPDPTKRSNAISEHLKIVEVKCEAVDEKVLNVLKFLSKLSINSFRFNFEE